MVRVCVAVLLRRKKCISRRGERKTLFVRELVRELVREREIESEAQKGQNRWKLECECSKEKAPVWPKATVSIIASFIFIFSLALFGTTFFISHDHTISILPLVLKNPGFDPAQDFVPVAGEGHVLPSGEDTPDGSSGLLGPDGSDLRVLLNLLCICHECRSNELKRFSPYLALISAFAHRWRG